jgi:hypothetical protein
MDMEAYDAFFYFPYTQGDTIRLMHNHSNTLVFIAGEKSKTYDERSWTPEADGKPCTNYYHTQNIKQDLKTASETISLIRYVDEYKMFIHQCSPCQWSYKVSIGKTKFESTYPGYFEDSIVVNNTVYKNIRYMISTSSRDTIYFSNKGIIRIVLPPEIYDRVIK